ncbi:MAG: hypothetical protein KF893_08305, partial [Caldilineaceae bacterium]|nr:hypothetical protein [Caldilineaceae bacterium]
HSMLITALAREKERHYQQGIEQGIEQGREQGIEEGREEGRMEIVLAMFMRGFDLTVIADITGRTVDEIQRIVAHAAQTGE